ncbi:MAG: hypothetical protein M3N29_10515 [Chloroflexota bacterium]|nr:hypothetical protein [Chloroflexota bacterium]
MAERKKASENRRGKQDEAKEKANKAEQAEAEQKAHSELDNPMLPDQADEMRHLIYYVSVVGGALVLNLVVMFLLSGGR